MRKGISLLALVFAVATVGTSGCCSVGWSYQIGQPAVISQTEQIMVNPGQTVSSMQAVGGYAGPVASGTWMTGAGHSAVVSPAAAPPVLLAAPPCAPATLPMRSPDLMTCEQWCARMRAIQAPAAPMPQAPPAHPENREE